MQELICQSCGMPMKVPEQFGTNKTGGRSHDYCRFCYVDGSFTADIGMDEMIELCARYTDQWDMPDGRKPTREEAIALMKKHFPQLKRWAKKKGTENEYHKAVNRVVDHINSHLSDPVDLETLAGVANISAFHFHRIFRSIMGENIGEYVQRLRLENAAMRLRSTPMLLEDIALKTGYQSMQALSKAFKKHFGISPSAYRNTAGNNALHRPAVKSHRLNPPEIRKTGDIRYVYIRIIDVYGASAAYNIAWGKLYSFARQNQIINERTCYLGLSFDDPTITSPSRCRFYACITIEKDIKPQGEFGIQTIKGGHYAVFTLKGPYSGLMDMYNSIYSQWLPSGGYQLRNSVSFEKYLNDPENMNEEELLTEIYPGKSLNTSDLFRRILIFLQQTSTAQYHGQTEKIQNETKK